MSKLKILYKRGLRYFNFMNKTISSVITIKDFFLRAIALMHYAILNVSRNEIYIFHHQLKIWNPYLKLRIINSPPFCLWALVIFLKLPCFYFPFRWLYAFVTCDENTMSQHFMLTIISNSAKLCIIRKGSILLKWKGQSPESDCLDSSSGSATRNSISQFPHL